MTEKLPCREVRQALMKAVTKVWESHYARGELSEKDADKLARAISKLMYDSQKLCKRRDR